MRSALARAVALLLVTATVGVGYLYGVYEWG